MKLTSLLILASLASLLASAAAEAPSPDKNTSPGSPAAASSQVKSTSSDARRDHYPLRGELVSVSPTLLVLKGGKAKPERRFEITSETKITKDDHPATVSDAKEGQQVTGYVHKNDKGNPRIVSLNLSPKQKEKADAAKDGKKGEAGPDKKKAA